MGVTWLATLVLTAMAFGYTETPRSAVDAGSPLPGGVSLIPFDAASARAGEAEACRSALWARDLWSGFVFNQAIWRDEPLELMLAVQDPNDMVSEPAVKFHASWLYGVNVTFVAPGTAGALPMEFPDTPAALDDSGNPLAGLLDHDRFFARYSTTDVYRTETHYGIKIWARDNVDLVLLHELGHALGLGHVDNTGNIMNNERAALGTQDCSSWVLHHVHDAVVGWELPQASSSQPTGE